MNSTNARPSVARGIDPRCNPGVTAAGYNLPEHGLRRGDVVMLVDELTARDGSPGYAVEVFNAVGDTSDLYFIPRQRRRAAAGG